MKYLLFSLCGLFLMGISVSSWAMDEDLLQDIHSEEVGVRFALADGSHYDSNYAQNFERCPQHFADGAPPALASDLQSETYPLCFRGFAVLYSGKSRTALYTAQHLTARQVDMAGQMTREDSFRPELRLPSDVRATLTDYQKSGYDRGHLVPNGDMSDKDMQYDSFSLANIVAQDGAHNRELWREIESQTRQLSSSYGEVYVWTGAVFATQTVDSVGKVLVPTHLYKAIYVPSLQQAGVYYSQNHATTQYEVLSVDELQTRTGVDILPNRQVDLLDLPAINQAPVPQKVTWLGFVQAVLAYLADVV